MLRTRTANCVRQNVLNAVCRRYASNASALSVTNLQSRWKSLTENERTSITDQLRERQKGDWKDLSLEEKKAAYFVAFGPYGPREPFLKTGHGRKVILGICIAIGVSTGLYVVSRAVVSAKPKTLTKEWEEATNEWAKENKINPITGISSENYSGPGYVQSK
ncbi:6052_t:CDS:2 [Paraglomus occultum]|uniref:6052_t:CDS:1 n=1 Tax=Paraglomus occultum TaxID=144539 RepID=A0A9N8Z6I5_9GLOM|nr:6052_t:CDS:2 [Paraglomus occultum]